MDEFSRFEKAVINNNLLHDGDIMDLSDEDFAIYHHKLMRTFVDTKGWWVSGRIPHCCYCEDSIKTPKDLVVCSDASYYGAYHIPCLDKYSKERNLKPNELLKRVLKTYDLR